MIADVRKSAEQKMKKTLEALKSDLGKVRTGRAHTGILDHIVIDSPPLGVFPDAMFLASHAHDVIYVVNYGKVSRQAVKECVMQFENTPAKVCGIVINRRKPGGRPNGYYGYRYSYASKYKRYYANSPKSSRDGAAAVIPAKRNSA